MNKNLLKPPGFSRPIVPNVRFFTEKDLDRIPKPTQPVEKDRKIKPVAINMREVNQMARIGMRKK